MVRIDKASVKKMAAEMPSTNESNPQEVPQNVRTYAYTLEQFYELFSTGGWTGGYVISFGREIGPDARIQYIDDVIYVDGYDCDGNPCPEMDESGELGGGGDDSGLITGEDDPVAGDKNYTIAEFYNMLEDGTWKGGFVSGFYFDKNGHAAKYGGTFGTATVVGHRTYTAQEALEDLSSAISINLDVYERMVDIANSGIRTSKYVRMVGRVGGACQIISMVSLISEAWNGEEDAALHIGEEFVAAALMTICPVAGITLNVLNASGATDYLIKSLINSLCK